MLLSIRPQVVSLDEFPRERDFLPDEFCIVGRSEKRSVKEPAFQQVDHPGLGNLPLQFPPESCCDRLWEPRGSDEPPENGPGHVAVAQLAHGGHFGQRGMSLASPDGKDLDFPALVEGNRVPDAELADLHLSGCDVGEHLRRPFVGNMHEPRAGSFLNCGRLSGRKGGLSGR